MGPVFTHAVCFGGERRLLELFSLVNTEICAMDIASTVEASCVRAEAKTDKTKKTQSERKRTRKP